MEDCNTLIADCIVVSCCCQCLILQLVVLIFVHLPRKMARKTKDYAKKKLACTRSRKGKGTKNAKKGDNQRRGEYVGLESEKSMSTMSMLELEGIALNKLHEWGNCKEEVDKMLGELSMKGEFAFGSFWGKKDDIHEEESIRLCCKLCSKSMTKEEVLEFGSHVVKYHLIQVAGPLNSSS